MNHETRVMRAVRLALNSTDRVRVVRNHVGFDRIVSCKYGLGVGSADLVGMLADGRGFACEVKTATGRLSVDQKQWLAAFRSWGGFACVARTAEEALAALDRAERGESV